MSQVSKFMHTPKTPHLNVINRILRYLKGNLEKKFWMRKNDTNDICGYVNADCAGIFHRKLITEFCIFIGENLDT